MNPIAIYFNYLSNRYSFLDFHGMGVSFQLPIQVQLSDLYIPLFGTVRCNSTGFNNRPNKDNAAVNTDIPENLKDPLETIVKNLSSVVILGDPGSGKTTFLKHLVLECTLGHLNKIPFIASLRDFHKFCVESGSSKDLLRNFLTKTIDSLGLQIDASSLVFRALHNGQSLLLLDGLDEVGDHNSRHQIAQQINEYLAVSHSTGNRVVITSRLVGYGDVRLTAGGIQEVIISKFSDREIRSFAQKWCRSVSSPAKDNPNLEKDLQHEVSSLVEAIFSSKAISSLATNPLLLTILALMKRANLELPSRRVELYHKATDSLLKHWALARSISQQPGVSIDAVETMRIIAPLALQIHKYKLDDLASEVFLLDSLEKVLADRGIDAPRQAAVKLFEEIKAHTGLLIERGPNEYGFIHLTFQEYLAAVGICLENQDDLDAIKTLVQRMRSEPRWHEVILLIIGYIGIIQQRDQSASKLVNNLVRVEEGSPFSRIESLLLAGKAVADASPGGVTMECRRNVIMELAASFRDVHTRFADRFSIADVLGELGDHRKEVLDSLLIQYCYVPSATFSFNQAEQETVFESFWVSRFPITNSQFNEFLADNPSSIDTFWTDGGIAWRDLNRSYTSIPLDLTFKIPNHPAVTVTWFEAVAYTRWLSRRASASSMIPPGWRFSLLSESNWVLAAKGGMLIPHLPVIQSLNAITSDPEPSVELVKNPLPQRRFPWGAKFTGVECLCFATGNGSTASVGCFPEYASPYGAEDMCGGVWEWLSTRWGNDWFRPQYNPPGSAKVSDDRDDLSGGSNILRMVKGGSFQPMEEPHHLSIDYRTRNNPDIRNLSHGFRMEEDFFPLKC